MTRIQVTVAAFTLATIAAIALYQTPDHFIPFGTMYEPEAFYGSGNLHLGFRALLLWTIFLINIAILAGLTGRRFNLPSPQTVLDAGSDRQFFTVILIALFLLSQLVSWLVLDHYPRDVDHIARIFQAKTFASGQLTTDAPLLPEFFSVFAVISHEGQLFSKYAPGGALFLAVPQVLFGSSLVINQILGVTAALCFALAFRNWFGARSARLFLVFALLSPYFVFTIASFHSHVPALFLFSVLALLASNVSEQEGFSLTFILMGFVGGLLVMTREYTSVLISLPLVLYLLAVPPSYLARRFLALLSGVTLPISALLFYNSHLTGNPFLFPHLLADPEQVPWFGYKGHSVEQALLNLLNSFRLLNLNLLGWPYSLLLIPFFVMAKSRTAWMLLCCFLLLVAGYFANYWMDYSLGVRYYFEASLVLLGLSAIGYRSLSERLSQYHDNKVLSSDTLSYLVLVGFLFSFLVYTPKLTALYGNHYNGNVNTRVVQYAPGLPGDRKLILSVSVGGENGGYPSGFLANPLHLAAVLRNPSNYSDTILYARDLGQKNQSLINLLEGWDVFLYQYDPVGDNGSFYRLDSTGTKTGDPIRFPSVEAVEAD